MTRLVRSEKHRDYLLLILRVTIGVAFIWACAHKIRQPYDFLHAIYSYEIVGPKVGLLVAIMLPWFELLIGMSLLSGLMLGGAFMGVMASCLAFSIANAHAIASELSISCNCFGAIDAGMVGYGTLFRSIMFLICGIVGVCLVTVSQHRLEKV